MYAKVAMLLLVAASAAACAQNDLLACREVPTENGIKGPGCALDIAESEGQIIPERPVRAVREDTPTATPVGPSLQAL